VLDEEAWLAITVRISGLIWIILRWLVTMCLCVTVASLVKSYRRGRQDGGFNMVALHRNTNFRALRGDDFDDNVASAA